VGSLQERVQLSREGAIAEQLIRRGHTVTQRAEVHADQQRAWRPVGFSQQAIHGKEVFRRCTEYSEIEGVQPRHRFHLGRVEQQRSVRPEEQQFDRSLAGVFLRQRLLLFSRVGVPPRKAPAGEVAVRIYDSRSAEIHRGDGQQ